MEITHKARYSYLTIFMWASISPTILQHSRALLLSALVKYEETTFVLLELIISAVFFNKS